MIRSGFAVTSLVLGVLIPFGGFFFPPIAILAVVFGHSGLNEINKGYRQGRGMALTGIYFGWIAISAYAIFAALGIGYMIQRVS